MTGARRRAFQAEIAIKYCNSSARLTEVVFGWGRNTVETGLAEKRTGIVCVGAQSGFSGSKRWEERYPEAAVALGKLAEAHCQQDPYNLNFAIASLLISIWPGRRSILSISSM